MAASGRGAWVLVWRAAFGASIALLASNSACGKDAAPAPSAVPDAGSACEAGSEGCACVFGSGCRQGLLCIARRCLIPDDTPDMSEPPVPRRAPILPLPPEPGPSDSGSPPAPLDAGEGVSPLDAGTLADGSSAGD
jgi:hypothetical protein